MTKRRKGPALAAGLALALAALSARAHVPYLERADYSPTRPFVVNDVEQSKAMYAWLKNGQDIDVYEFDVGNEPVQLFAEIIVPVCTAYADFLPWYAVIGPGLAPPEQPLPVELPPGYGAIVVPNLPQGQPRPQIFEPFGGKSYYTGVQLRQTLVTPGRWSVIAWNPDALPGDYVMTIGEAERFGPKDIARSLVEVPLIRQDKELHISCERP